MQDEVVLATQAEGIAQTILALPDFDQVDLGTGQFAIRRQHVENRTRSRRRVSASVERPIRIW
jgi:hypothetical protein